MYNESTSLRRVLAPIASLFRFLIVVRRWEGEQENSTGHLATTGTTTNHPSIMAHHQRLLHPSFHSVLHPETPSPTFQTSSFQAGPRTLSTEMGTRQPAPSDATLNVRPATECQLVTHSLSGWCWPSHVGLLVDEFPARRARKSPGRRMYSFREVETNVCLPSRFDVLCDFSPKCPSRRYSVLFAITTPAAITSTFLWVGCGIFRCIQIKRAFTVLNKTDTICL